MSFKLQYISDVHLEFRGSYRIEPIAPNLALCGDIGWPETVDYHDFISDVSKKFKNVFVVFGNHEYYNSVSKEEKLSLIQKRKYTKNFPKNVYFLNNNCVYLDVNTNTIHKSYKDNCIKIIGSTLWTNITYSTSKLMNDYKCIYFKKDKLINHRNVVNLFKKAKEYILKEIQKEPNVKCILLSHHGTHPVFFGYNRNDLLFSAYTNNIPELYKQKNLIASISGHSHYSITEKLYFENSHSIYFLSNQLGYPNETSWVTKFKPNKIFSYYF
jgi:hypothetical protein